jgi:hypothetical protein
MPLALGQGTHHGRLEVTAERTAVDEHGVLRVRDIHVTYCLWPDQGIDLDAVRQARERHHRFSPMAASIGAAVNLPSELMILSS